MPRLIDADAYKRVLEGWLADMQSTEEHAEREAILSCICQLDATQTVDDTPVVRCKDCANFRQSAHGFCWCDEYANSITPNDYCSRAVTDERPHAKIQWEAD